LMMKLMIFDENDVIFDRENANGESYFIVPVETGGGELEEAGGGGGGPPFVFPLERLCPIAPVNS